MEQMSIRLSKAINIGTIGTDNCLIADIFTFSIPVNIYIQIDTVHNTELRPIYVHCPSVLDVSLDIFDLYICKFLSHQIFYSRMIQLNPAARLCNINLTIYIAVQWV